MYLFAGKRRQSDVGSFLKKAADEGIITLDLEEIDIERSSKQDEWYRHLWFGVGPTDETTLKDKRGT